VSRSRVTDSFDVTVPLPHGKILTGEYATPHLSADCSQLTAVTVGPSPALVTYTH